MKNYWSEHGDVLAQAYARKAGSVRFDVVTRALLSHMPARAQRVVDIGGGYGRQAIMLARAGHAVTIVDQDQNMLAMAKEALSEESPEVRSRVECVLSQGETAKELIGSDFDLVCCHSVLMYLDDPAPMLAGLVDLARPGGLISILSLNPQARAMRGGLQGRWREAIALLTATQDLDSQYLQCAEHSHEEIVSFLDAVGAREKAWYGVGIFTDHLPQGEGPSPAELADACEAEWLAGSRDPYRQVARCFHVIAERT